MDYNASGMGVAAKKKCDVSHNPVQPCSGSEALYSQQSFKLGTGHPRLLSPIQCTVWPNLNYWSQSRFLLLRCYSAE